MLLLGPSAIRLTRILGVLVRDLSPVQQSEESGDGLGEDASLGLCSRGVTFWTLPDDSKLPDDGLLWVLLCGSGPPVGRYQASAWYRLGIRLRLGMTWYQASVWY